MRSYRNERPRAEGAPPTHSPRPFHRRLPGYAVSPLVDARALAAELGVRQVLVKDESARLGLPSFKILGASWGTYRALERHIGALGGWKSVEDLRAALRHHLPLSLAAATDGNHGRAVARMARLLGLGARIFVPAGTAPARTEAIASEGAACTVVDGTYEDAVARAAEEAGDDCLVISDTSWPGYEDVPRWVIDGYSTIFDELDEQLESPPDVVAIQVGVGALAAAAVRHFRRAPGAPTMIAVEPERAACVLASVEAGDIVTVPGPHDSIMAGLNCGTPSFVAWPDVRAGFDLYLAVPDEGARGAMRALARDGIVAGETGAAGAAGVIEAARAGVFDLPSDATVLLLSTEGATDPAAYRRIVG